MLSPRTPRQCSTIDIPVSVQCTQSKRRAHDVDQLMSPSSMLGPGPSEPPQRMCSPSARNFEKIENMLQLASLNRAAAGDGHKVSSPCIRRPSFANIRTASRERPDENVGATQDSFSPVIGGTGVSSSGYAYDPSKTEQSMHPHIRACRRQRECGSSPSAWSTFSPPAPQLVAHDTNHSPIADPSHIYRILGCCPTDNPDVVAAKYESYRAQFQAVQQSVGQLISQHASASTAHQLHPPCPGSAMRPLQGRAWGTRCDSASPLRSDHV